MGLLTEVEAAIKTGYSIELLRYFAKKCPKASGDEKLKSKVIDGQYYYDDSDLRTYQTYLNNPWPKPAKGTRPSIPDAIKEDIKKESHYGCAICGHMDNGEIAHIDPVAENMNNSPDNLIFLCPNHHTKYDYGFKPNSNITIDVIKAAKLIKRQSRQRMLMHEANTTKLLQSIIKSLKAFEEKVKDAESPDLAAIYTTEMHKLAASIPEAITIAENNAKNDQEFSESDKIILNNAPKIALAISGKVLKKDSSMRTAVSEIIDLSEEILIDIDEVDCPHCHGQGMTGLIGDLCAFCHGSMVVSSAKYNEYDPDDIDEKQCPHCNGRGTTGLAGDLCSYCDGSMVVSSAKYDKYDPDDLDEKQCPHCNGRGTTGLVGDFCSYCDGSMVVSSAKYDKYDPDDIDEKQCPHCNGQGTTGLVGDFCSYCDGSMVVSSAKYDKYDPDDLDEKQCPHCNGRGTTGLAGDLCSYCDGSMVVSSAKYDKYDPDDLDEKECPHCNGRGTTGLIGDLCAFCEGSCVVTKAKANAYHKKYGR